MLAIALTMTATTGIADKPGTGPAQLPKVGALRALRPVVRLHAVTTTMLGE